MIMKSVEYTLQEESQSTSHLRVRSFKNPSRLLFGKDKTKEVFEIYKNLTQ